MSTVTYAPKDRIIYRKSVMFCVLPRDLSRHLDELRRYCADLESVEVVVEARRGTDRRQASDGAPAGGERRRGDRRRDEASQTASEAGFELPRSLRRHADRIICTWRSVPVHFQDAAREADLLLAAADADSDAREELRLRYYPSVYDNLRHKTPWSSQRVELTDSVFDELFAHHQSNAFNRELGGATSRAHVSRWPRRGSPARDVEEAATDSR